MVTFEVAQIKGIEIISHVKMTNLRAFRGLQNTPKWVSSWLGSSRCSTAKSNSCMIPVQVLMTNNKYDRPHNIRSSSSGNQIAYSYNLCNVAVKQHHLHDLYLRHTGNFIILTH